MAHCRAEVEEMTSLAGALVLNIGTICEDWLESMILAAKTANSIGIPVVLDPVGAGATRMRTDAVKRIMAECFVTVLRGNCSEILSLGLADVRTKGVDSSMALSEQTVAAIVQMAAEKNCIIGVSGQIDCITDGTNTYRVENGHPMMGRVTGSGCGLSAVAAAFCAAAENDLCAATAAAFGFYGLCGDLAIRTSGKPGSFQVAFMDALYSAGSRDIEAHLKVSRG
jgi:hydroxyethylthiazole kinase